MKQLFSVLNKQYDDVMSLMPDRILIKSRLDYITDGVRQGNHWTLLALNTKQKVEYYGDSLRWETPSY